MKKKNSVLLNKKAGRLRNNIQSWNLNDEICLKEAYSMAEEKKGSISGRVVETTKEEAKKQKEKLEKKNEK